MQCNLCWVLHSVSVRAELYFPFFLLSEEIVVSHNWPQGQTSTEQNVCQRQLNGTNKLYVDTCVNEVVRSEPWLAI